LIRHDRAQGTIYLEQGEVVHAHCESEEGAAAFQRIMAWRSGRFQTKAGKRAPYRSIHDPFHHLLLETLHVLDERAAGASRARAESPLTLALTSSSRTSAANRADSSLAVAAIDWRQLGEIDGFLAGYLVDSDDDRVLGAFGENLAVLQTSMA